VGYKIYLQTNQQRRHKYKMNSNQKINKWRVKITWQNKAELLFICVHRHKKTIMYTEKNRNKYEYAHKHLNRRIQVCTNTHNYSYIYTYIYIYVYIKIYV
jgi:hypothetical protein